jgi:hypothetical protein
MIKNSFLLVVSFVIAHFSFSQVVVKPKIHQFGNTNCDFEVLVSAMNLPANSTLSWKRFDSIGIQILNDQLSIGDTLSGFCSETDQISCFLEGNEIAFSMIFGLEGDFQIIDYMPPTSPVASNGSIVIQFDSTQQNVWFSNANGDEYVFNEIDDSTFSISNLEYGYLTIQSSPINNGLGYNGMSIFVGDPSFLIPQGNLDVNLNYNDVTTGCNGLAEVSVNNAIGNVYYQWSIDNQETGSQVDSICPGLYSVYITDDGQQHAYIQFAITDTASNYNDPEILTEIINDTAYFYWVDCQIDYNSPIDSANYVETFVSQSGDTAIYAINLTVYQGANTYVFSDTLQLTTDSNMVISAVIYCQEFKSTLFDGKRVNVLRKEGIAALTDFFNPVVEVFPNPATDQLHIKGIEPKGFLLDMNGRAVMEVNNQTLLKLAGVNSVYKIIKE